jgi:hypothetical protein
VVVRKPARIVLRGDRPLHQFPLRPLSLGLSDAGAICVGVRVESALLTGNSQQLLFTFSLRYSFVLSAIAAR